MPPKRRGGGKQPSYLNPRMMARAFRGAPPIVLPPPAAVPPAEKAVARTLLLAEEEVKPKKRRRRANKATSPVDVRPPAPLGVEVSSLLSSSPPELVPISGLPPPPAAAKGEEKTVGAADDDDDYTHHMHVDEEAEEGEPSDDEVVLGEDEMNIPGGSLVLGDMDSVEEEELTRISSRVARVSTSEESLPRGALAWNPSPPPPQSPPPTPPQSPPPPRPVVSCLPLPDLDALRGKPDRAPVPPTPSPARTPVPPAPSPAQLVTLRRLQRQSSHRVLPSDD